MGEIITEGKYTRTHSEYIAMLMTGFVILVAAMGILYIAELDYMLAAEFGVMMFTLGLWIFSAAVATKRRGYCFTFWRWLDEDHTWALDDIDAEEFADGPIELEQ